ncbi:MAG: hypothetical protein HY951_12625 [Bacteroidia bacterium]|nr:hypothetical protein [Bacteroidia bacterium]
MPDSLTKKHISFRDFIGYDENILIYLHNTFLEETAISIINEGFKFIKSLDYTTDNISNINEIEVNYFLVKRKFYGKHTIVIQIGVEILKFYSDLIDADDKVLKEMIFSQISDELNEDDQNYNILHKQFIKGYYNHETKEGVYSPFFNPHEKSDTFHENLKKNKQ